MRATPTPLGVLLAGALVGALGLSPLPAAAQVAPPVSCRGHAALTFDDGPRAPYTEQMLAVLVQRKVRAVFFVVGKRAEAQPALVRQTRAAGHQVFSHTYSHARLGDDIEPKGLDYKATKAEILGGHQTIENVLGTSVPRRWRSPFLRYSGTRVVQRASGDLGFVHVAGTSTKDWDPQVSDREVIRRTERAFDTRRDGTILILHDGVSNGHRTVRLLPQIIDEMHRREICDAGIGPNGSVLARPHRPTVRRSRSAGNVRLDWAPSGPASAAPAAYRVYRSETTTRPKEHLRHTRGLTYTDTSVRSGRTYYYWVEGRNEAGKTLSLRHRIAIP
jgi:peptidoglycan/xylan/chitin deacetylase (PgdA/CDA1 family)